MSAGVDVLAVMKRDQAHAEAYRVAHGYVGGTLAEAAHESSEAYAAVAALIESDQLLDGCNWFDEDPCDIDDLAAAKRLKLAALARVTGGAT